jgi:DNA-binding NtrC family response regulator
MPNLLIVDDEPNVVYSLEKGLNSETLAVFSASTARSGIEAVQSKRVDAIILDVRLPDMPGLEAFHQIRTIAPQIPVIIITAFAATETAIEAMKLGAFEYLVKPVNLRQLREIVAKAVELSRLRKVPAVFDGEAATDPAAVDLIVGQSAAMQEVYKTIGRVAPQDVTALILGESGTGKELVARAVLHHSRRKDRHFLAINCAAIPDTLLESELFGHERGAFTSADRRRIGKFEQANGGTVFLDEIGDMPSATQAKMLRLLQERQFERIGGNETVSSDIRIIAATNQDLEELVASGCFREDLYYRLKVATIRLPPLRERMDDLGPLVEHFLRIYSRELNKKIRSIEPQGLLLLKSHSWPGNIRELQNVIKEAILRTPGDFLTSGDLLPSLSQRLSTQKQTSPEIGLVELSDRVLAMLEAGEKEIYQKICAEMDRVLLETVLRFTKGNQLQASEFLGIARTTLRTKLRQIGLSLEKQLHSNSQEPSP